MHFKQLEQLTKDSFNLSIIVYAEETEQSVLDNLMHPGVHSVNSIKVAHYSQKSPTPKGVGLFSYIRLRRVILLRSYIWLAPSYIALRAVLEANII